MSEDIKEIYLSNLEWTKTHDNMGGVMGNIVFKNNIAYDDYQQLFKSGYFVLCNKDYITNLQKQLQQKENIIKEVREKLLKLNDKFKLVSAIPFNISEIMEMIEILDKSDKNE